jgi:hypothetical protein
VIKTFLKHHIYEKCIEIIFDGITKAFKKPDPKYRILHIEKTKEGKFIKKVYTVEHNGKTFTIVMQQQENMRDDLVTFHGMTPEQADRELDSIIIAQIEQEIRIQEVGVSQAMEELIGHSLPEGGGITAVGVDDNGNTVAADIDFDNLPDEIKEHIKELEDQGFYDPDADFVGNWLEDKLGDKDEKGE